MANEINNRWDCGDYGRGSNRADLSSVAGSIYRPGGFDPIERPSPCPGQKFLPSMSLSDSSAEQQQQQQVAGKTNRHGAQPGDGERDARMERQYAGDTNRHGSQPGSGERDAALDRRYT